MADLPVDNHLDLQNRYELKRALLEKNPGLITSYVLARLYMDTTSGKAYIQDGATNIEITRQGTVTSVATSQPSIISISTATTIPTISIAYATALQDGLMSSAQASMLADASETHVAGKLVKWNSGAGANINGTASNVTASLDQIPAPAAAVNMNNKQFSSLATATAAGQATEYSQFSSHVTASNIHTPLDDASHANNRVVSALEVDNRIAASVANAGGSVKAGVADVTALKALDTTSATTYPDKAIILVEDSGTYRLDRDSVEAEDVPRIVAPTTGVGMWYRITTQLSDHNNMNSIQGGSTGQYYHLTLNQNQAASGTAGSPSNTNRYVTNDDPRNTNSRTPSGSAGGDLSGSYPNPTVTGISFTVGLDEGGTGATTAAAARKTIGVPEIKHFDITGTTALVYNAAHALNNSDAIGEIYELVSPGVYEKLHFVKITNTTVNNTQFEFGFDCTGREFRATITGLDLNP